MNKFVKSIAASVLMGVLGLVVGTVTSTAWERAKYPNDPDPVDFTTAIIFFSIWLGIWLFGTLIVGWLIFRTKSVAAS